jgi:hypothetical protein
MKGEKDVRGIDDQEVVEEVVNSAGRRRWVALTWLFTWWIPSFFLSRCGGMKRSDVRMAWREKLLIKYVLRSSSSRARTDAHYSTACLSGSSVDLLSSSLPSLVTSSCVPHAPSSERPLTSSTLLSVPPNTSSLPRSLRRRLSTVTRRTCSSPFEEKRSTSPSLLPSISLATTSSLSYVLSRYSV